MEQHHVVSHSHSGRRCAVLFLLLLLLDQRTAYGQSEAGSATLTGTVFDASGAVVSAARVTVTHRDAGWSRETVTNDAGLYTVAPLPPGPYVIVAGRDGFQTVRREGVELLVGSRTVVDAVLQPGTIEQTLTVSAAAPVIDAGRTHAGSVVNERAVRNLPINGRNFLDFTLLAPHVIRDPRVAIWRSAASAVRRTACWWTASTRTAPSGASLSGGPASAIRTRSAWTRCRNFRSTAARLPPRSAARRGALSTSSPSRAPTTALALHSGSAIER